MLWRCGCQLFAGSVLPKHHKGRVIAVLWQCGCQLFAGGVLPTPALARAFPKWETGIPSANAAGSWG